MKINKKIIFIISFLLVCLIYNYYHIFQLGPRSIHQWRQTDCLSFAQNYYEDNVNFFEPSINWIGNNGTGKTISEFPILYYIVALLWKIFGKHEFIFRLLNFSIAFLGLFYLFKLATNVLKNEFWAIIISLTLFTSPIFAYYANNFLPNVPALSLVFIGWFFFYNFYKKGKNKYLYVSMLFFLFAGLLKISSTISFFTLLIIYFIEVFKITSLKKEGKIFNNPVLNIIPFILVMLCLFIWNIYTIHYNNLNNGVFFLHGILPIWDLNSSQIKFTLLCLYHDLLPQFFSTSLINLALILFIILLIFYKKVNKILLLITTSIFCATVCYLLLFFKVFDVHDYYLIDLLIFPIAVFFTFLSFLKDNYLKSLNSEILKVSILIVLICNVYYCAVNTRIKYDPGDKLAKNSFLFDQKKIDFYNWSNWYYDNTIKACETITPYLRSLGIQRSDKVISIPDRSLNISLYLMDQKGNTNLFYEPEEGEKNIKEFIKNGSKYLIINDKSLLDQDYIKPFLKDKIGEYENIEIYDLRNIVF